MATISKSLTVAAKSAYSLIINAIPTGSSATPANDIQTWLHCADIWDKTYTTISQVLADGPTLLALISSNNAVDYMVRSTNWASSVCANQMAMGYIGNNNYCSNKLLANSTWFNAICNSTYFESVLNVKVPTMTGATTPSGEASASQTYGSNYAFYAFDKNLGTRWVQSSSGKFANNAWIRYKFTQQIRLAKVMYCIPGSRQTFSIKIQGSNDGNTFYDLGSYNTTATTSSTYNTLIVNTNNKYQYIRWYFVDVSSADSSGGDMYELQFYGRA